MHFCPQSLGCGHNKTFEDITLALWEFYGPNNSSINQKKTQQIKNRLTLEDSQSIWLPIMFSQNEDCRFWSLACKGWFRGQYGQKEDYCDQQLS